jgi:hypothetical protein
MRPPLDDLALRLRGVPEVAPDVELLVPFGSTATGVHEREATWT